MQAEAKRNFMPDFLKFRFNK